MSKYNTEVVYKVTKEASGKSAELGSLYFKNVPVTFAQVITPGTMYNSDDKSYQMNIFINSDTLAKVEDIGLNKEFAEVGVTKIKKGKNRGKLKFPLDEHNAGYEGMHGVQLTRGVTKRDGNGVFVKTRAPLKLINSEGDTFKENVGNGSVCTVKCFSYRNEEDMLVVMLDTVMVVDHVPYEDGGDYFDEEMGVTIKSSNNEGEGSESQEQGGGKDEPSSAEGKPAEGNKGATDDSFDDDIPF